MKLIKVEIREIRKKFIKMLNIVLSHNGDIIDLIYSQNAHHDILNICLNDDITVIFLKYLHSYIFLGKVHCL